jgi:hypothetical protein
MELKCLAWNKGPCELLPSLEVIVVRQIKDSINTSTYKLYKFHHNSSSESEDNYKQDIYSYLNSDSEEIIHQLDLLNGW